MKRLLGVLGGAALTVNAYALLPNDFAYGLNVQLSGQSALYEITLPAAVYRTVTRADLRDVRVFNSQGEVVPHAFRPPVQVTQAPAAVSLPLFPLPVAANGDAINAALQIRTDARGTVIDVNRNANAPGTTTQDYLIDANTLTQLPDKLVLAWEAPPQGFSATVSIEYSDDLNQWQPLVAQAALAEISYDGHTLSQHDITLPRVRARYLRLHWPASTPEVHLKSVQASFPAVTQAPTPQWAQSPGQRIENDPAQLRNVSVYQFDTGGFFPIEQLRVRLPQQNALIEAVLLSRAAPSQPWRERYRGALYQLQMQGTQLQNTTLAVATTSDRYWRMEVDDRSGGLGNGRPAIDFGWVPQRMAFVAQGAAPFTLAYGSALITAPAVTAAALLNDLEARASQGLVKPAQLGEAVVLGGASRLQPAPPGLPWKAWLLWAALVSGVGVLGFMVWRLVRQMSASASSP